MPDLQVLRFDSGTPIRYADLNIPLNTDGTFGGNPVFLSDLDKAIQDLVKGLLTLVGTNNLAPNYGTSIKALLNARNVGQINTRLLEQIRDEGKPRSVLFFWDKLLVENGAVITQKRQEYLDFVNQRPAYFGKLQLDYNKSVISPQRLEEYANGEVAAGMTLVGPHRDDFQISQGERNLHAFGSRGEQRTAVFSLKLAELEFIAQKANDRPVLLLDDVFSELDHQHRERVLEVIPKQQTIITTTDPHLVKEDYQKKMEMVKLE